MFNSTGSAVDIRKKAKKKTCSTFHGTYGMDGYYGIEAHTAYNGRQHGKITTL